MAIRVNIQGVISPPEQAKISVFDRGFLFGDGVYETCRTYGGRPFLLSAHIRRLRRSCEAIGIDGLADESAIIHQVQRTLDSADNPDSLIRIIATRGVSDGFSLVPEEGQPSHLVVIVRPLEPREGCPDGVDVLVPVVRAVSPKAMPGWIKSSNRLVQIKALEEGRRKGADEVILLDEQGFVAEGAASNVFFMRGDVLCTPSVTVGILPGLTRSVVLGLARQAGVPTKSGMFRPGDVMGGEEVFLTGNMKGILPVRRVDGQPIEHCPGPVTRALFDSYQLLTERFARGELSEGDIEALIDDDSDQVGA